MVGSSRQVKTPSGAPCFTAASYMMRMASRQQVQAFGWGPKMTALRVLMAMMHLNSTVAVGLVMGVIEKISALHGRRDRVSARVVRTLKARVLEFLFLVIPSRLLSQRGICCCRQELCGHPPPEPAHLH